jgi:hypothetical protein
MFNEIIIPGKETDRVGGLIDLAKVLQFGIENGGKSNVRQRIDSAIEILGDTENLDADRDIMLHASKAVLLGVDPIDKLPEEIEVSHVHVRGRFDLISHLELLGEIPLNSLCVTVGGAEIIRVENEGFLKQGAKLPETDRLVVPVLEIQSYFAA